MDQYYKQKEIDLLMPSIEELIKNRSFKAYITYGKKGLGKTTLIKELFEKILSDQTLLYYMPKLSRNDIIATEYRASDPEKKQAYAYKAFIEIAKITKKRRKLLSILKIIFGVLISVVGFGDLVDKLEELAKEVTTTEAEEDEKFRKKEVKLFRQFTKELQRLTHKKPLKFRLFG